MEYGEFLAHHGILGMKWGVRRYQNEDGTLTAAGKARYKKVYNDPKLKAKEEKQMFVLSLQGADHQSRMESVYKNRAQKYRQEGKEDLAKQADAQAIAAHRTADLLLEKVSDLDSGKLQAGRDFILQNDYNLTLSGLYKQISVIEKKKD